MTPFPFTPIPDEAEGPVTALDLFDLDGETFLRVHNGRIETGTPDLLSDGGA